MDSFQLKSKRLRSSASLNVSGGRDYISSLPDEIIAEILDKLTFDEAVSTMFLSKRWKDLWMLTKRIELGFQWVQKTGRNVLPSIFKILGDDMEDQIEAITVSIQYKKYRQTKVQNLILLASMKNVKELYIDFDDTNDDRKWRKKQCKPFCLPECETSSLVKLGLKSLELKILPHSYFRALEQLFLEQVTLKQDSVDSIVTICPSLTVLSLHNCNRYLDLKIIITADASKLHLVIKEEMYHVNYYSAFFIKGTGVKSIAFVSALPRANYCIEGILNCSDSVTFKLDEFRLAPHGRKFVLTEFRGSYTKNFIKLLGKFTMAKVITLCSWCIQVLAVEIKMLLSTPPGFSATFLVLRTGFTKWEFVGMGYMLLGCCQLERLVISMGAPGFLSLIVPDDQNPLGFNFQYDNILQNLEVVEFRNYGADYTWEGDDFHEHLFFAGFQYGSLFLWNLKVYAKNLKKVSFETKRQLYVTNNIQRFGDLEPYKDFEYQRLPPFHV